MKERFKEQGSLLTVSAVVLIIVGGLLLIDRPANWVSILLIVVAILGIVATFLRVRVIIKFSITIFIVLLAATSIFELGLSIDPSGRIGSMWGLLYLSFFFLTLGISYLLPAPYSRWTILTLSSIVSWVATLFVTMFSLSILLGLIAMSSGVFFFLLVYLLPYRLKAKSYPPNYFKEGEIEKVKKQLNKIGFGYTEFTNSDKSQGYLLTWSYENPSAAYILYPVKMEQPFGTIGRKKRQGLSYKGVSINPWLQKIYWSVTKNSLIGGGPLLVLLKVGQTSKDVKIIGMKNPDQTSDVPVGVISSVSAKSFKELEPYTGVLKEKQILRFEEINEAKEEVKNV